MDEVDEKAMKEIGKRMYKIEVETATNKKGEILYDLDGNKIVTFELVTIQSGAINSGLVALGPQDPNFNSKHPQFVETCVKLGLGDQLLETVKKTYG